MDKLQIEKVNVKEFGNFVSSLIPISDFIYLKATQDELTSTCYLPQKDAVKLHKSKLETVFKTSQTIDKQVKIAFFDGNKVMNALSFFNGVTPQGTLTLSENEDHYLATSLVLRDNDLSITLACAEPSLGFSDIPDDKLQSILDSNDSKFNFVLENDMIKKLKSLFKLEGDKDTFTVHLANDKVNVVGKAYNVFAGSPDQTQVSEYTSTLYKKYLSLLERYDYHTFVCDSKLVFESPDKNTKLTVAICEEN